MRKIDSEHNAILTDQYNFGGITKDAFDQLKAKPVLTWAPSHIEVALLGDLLRYANIVDGLKESDKRKLRKKFEINISIRDDGVFVLSRFDDEEIPDIWFKLGTLVGSVAEHKNEERDIFVAIRLEAEYIDYLKEVLKPYI